MTTHSTTTYHLPAIHLAAPLSAALQHIALRLRDLRQRRALAAELSDLSDRELADIGMARAAAPGTPFGLPYALYR